MGVVEFSEVLNGAIQAGSAVEGNVARIIADNGAEIGEGVFEVLQGGNGVASEVGVATQTAGGSAVATGLAYLSMPVSATVAAAGAALGLVAGAGIYALNPTAWRNISDELVNAGKTVGGNVIAYWNGENFYLDEETIEIIKNALVAEGLFEQLTEYPEPQTQFEGNLFVASSANVSVTDMLANVIRKYGLLWGNIEYAPGYESAVLPALANFISSRPNHVFGICATNLDPNDIGTTMKGYDLIRIYDIGVLPVSESLSPAPMSNMNIFSNSKYCFMIGGEGYPEENLLKIGWTYQQSFMPQCPAELGEFVTTDVPYAQGISSYVICNANATYEPSPYIQEGATLPNADDPFPQTYPEWYPLEYPQTLPDPSALPSIYPLKYPEVEPDPYPEQEPAQNPNPESVPDIYPEILPRFPLGEPGINPDPQPEPDPDIQPDPDPLPENSDPITDPDPTNPNPDPIPSPAIPIPALPSTVNSSKLFTVYNPTASQLDGLGGYLWDSSIIAALRDIWQDPMDGLISLQQVYVTPVTSGSHNIILGFLDSGVSSKVVSDQFVTVDCGSVTIKEDKNNATDYAPYTSIHLYLPFIGIVELDTNECMNSTMSIKYKVDVYTGTCLAEVSIDRDVDMPNDPILYTFSGNCSQQLPLTSGNSTGLLNALIGAVTAGFSAASGGGLSTLAGAQMIGNSLTHEMFHVSHSGNISANAGIMGQKKPYVIIGRRHGYDANNYNSYYGYPANKTVIIGNHEGFIKVKKCWIKTSALQEEYDEIMRLLEDGVFI